MRLAAVSLDCADPQRLANFFLAVLGGRQLGAKESSARLDVSGVVLVMQLVERYAPPVWPGSEIVHMDLTADDVEAAAERAVTLWRYMLGAAEPAVARAARPSRSPVLPDAVHARRV